jgi:hypothetical protein
LFAASARIANIITAVLVITGVMVAAACEARRVSLFTPFRFSLAQIIQTMYSGN